MKLKIDSEQRQKTALNTKMFFQFKMFFPPFFLKGSKFYFENKTSFSAFAIEKLIPFR